jgi:hypothetical protein
MRLGKLEAKPVPGLPSGAAPAARAVGGTKP